MASRDLTQSFIDRRNAAIRKRNKEGGTCVYVHTYMGWLATGCLLLLLLLLWPTIRESLLSREVGCCLLRCNVGSPLSHLLNAIILLS